MKPLTAAAASLILLSPLSHGAITYVDAVEGASGNTFATGGDLATTTWVGGNVTGNLESQWARRTTFGNGGVVFQARHEITDVGGDQMPELTTQITGLTDGSQYDVWVFFWDADAGNFWNIAAGLTTGALTTYSFDGLGDTDSEVAASTLTFDTSVMTVEGNRILYGVNLGPVTASGTTINVFVDNLTGLGATGHRTWYDGVGYEVVPEPSAALLIGLGGLALLRRRRA